MAQMNFEAGYLTLFDDAARPKCCKDWLEMELVYSTQQRNYHTEYSEDCTRHISRRTHFATQEEAVDV